MRKLAIPALSCTFALMLGSAPVLAQSEVVWARDGDIDSFDPQRATSTLSRMVWYQIYDSLLEFDLEGNLVPSLARDWEVGDDGLAVTFHLQDGVKCHDGTDFTASDVKFTADRALDADNPSLTKASWGPISNVVAVDDLTVRFEMSEPFGAFVPFMADEFTSMICESAAEHGDDYGNSVAIGTGPWMLESWTKGSEIVLASNPDYVNFGRPVDNAGPPHMDRLVISTLPEGQTRLAGLRTGNLDVIVPPVEAVAEIKADPAFNFHSVEVTGQNMFLQFAAHRFPFNDARARQAVAHAIDFDLALDIVFEGLVQRELCPVSSGVFGNDQEFCARHGQAYDPDKAAQLLEELGHGPDNPLPVVLMTWTGDNRSKLLEFFQNQLSMVGFAPSIEVMDIGTLNARVTTENQKAEGPGSMNLMGWTWFDPDILYLLWRSPGAYEGYNTPELDKLLDLTRTTVDSKQRLPIVQDVMKHLLEEAVHVPIYSPGWLWMYASRAEVEGFKLGAFDRPLFNDVNF
jgi:peptide/nickel transport system substrate-binding protein